IVAELAHRDRVAAETTLDELGLSSLEHIELMTALEEQFDTTIDEAEFSNAQTVGDLEALVQQLSMAVSSTEKTTQAAEVAGQPAARTIRPRPSEAMTFPAWNRQLWARAARRASLPVWILPLARAFAWIQVHGLEHVQQLDG